MQTALVVSPYPLVAGSVVINTIVVDEGADLPAFEAIAAIDGIGLGCVYDGAAWAPPADTRPLEEIRAAKVAELSAACSGAIVGGFVSPALGAPHTYPSRATDQTNLMGSVVASMLPGVGPDWSTPFWCAAASGEWAFRPHSAAEIQAVGADGKSSIVACQARLADLVALVGLADNASEVSAILWGE